jgi:hypothetical protein
LDDEVLLFSVTSSRVRAPTFSMAPPGPLRALLPVSVALRRAVTDCDEMAPPLPAALLLIVTPFSVALAKSANSAPPAPLVAAELPVIVLFVIVALPPLPSQMAPPSTEAELPLIVALDIVMGAVIFMAPPRPELFPVNVTVLSVLVPAKVWT